MPAVSALSSDICCRFSYNKHIRHYYIFSKHDHQSRVLYAINVHEGYRWDSLRGLIDHYHRHPIDDGDLLLTAPIV